MRCLPRPQRNYSCLPVLFADFGISPPVYSPVCGRRKPCKAPRVRAFSPLSRPRRRTRRMRNWKNSGSRDWKPSARVTIRRRKFSGREGLAKAEAADNKLRQAQFHFNLGQLDWNNGKTESATQHITRARDLYRPFNDHTSKEMFARACVVLGLLLKEQQQSDEAARSLQKGIDAFIKMGESSLAGTAITALAQMQDDQGAIALYEKAVAQYKTQELNPQTRKFCADTYTAISITQDGIAEYKNAEQNSRLAIVLYGQMGQEGEEGKAHALSALGYALVGQARYDDAFAAHAEARKIREALGKTTDVILSLNDMGRASYNKGDFELARIYHKQALDLATKLNDPGSEAMSEDELGAVDFHLNQNEAALKEFGNAARLYGQAGQTRHQALSLMSQADILKRQRKFDESLAGYDAALQLILPLVGTRANPQSQVEVGQIYLGRGGVAIEQQQWERSRQELEKALTIFTAKGQLQYAALTHTEMGVAYRRQNRLPEAVAELNAAVALCKASGDLQSVAAAQVEISLIAHQQKDYAASDKSMAAALKAYETISGKLRDPGRVGAFQEANTRNLYGSYAHLLSLRGKREKALEIADDGRAQGLARQAAAHFDFAGLIKPDEAREWKQANKGEATAGAEVEEAYTRLALSNTAHSAEATVNLARARQALERARENLVRLRAQLSKSHPGIQRLLGMAPSYPALKALADRHPDTLYLEWVMVDEDSSLLLALSGKAGAQAIPLRFGEAELNTRASAWVKTFQERAAIENDRNQDLAEKKQKISRNDADERMTAGALANLLLPAMQKAGLRFSETHPMRVVIVPAGPLLDIPWAALPLPSGKRLVQGARLAISPSLDILTWPANTRKAAGSLLCVADPLGSGGEIHYANSPRSQRTATRDAAAERVPAYAFNSLRGGYGPLEHARAEGLEVVNQTPGAVCYVGNAARKSVLWPLLSRYETLFFATHGDVVSGNGLESCLILAPNSPTETEPGKLLAKEIMAMPLAAKLAVLSACKTGLGQRSGGEGLLGLAWAFRAAGCPCVVASLWSVQDTESSLLMLRFYKLLRNGEAKDEALRHAMMEVCREQDAPYFWAAFQVIGNYDAVYGNAIKIADTRE